ncbi:MAG: trypsin-like peptidase domain-containing protein [Magnetococcales bacterium]|nr:trypsin-like peptidase domain-containing protein [Magnetococcales bacterium]
MFSSKSVECGLQYRKYLYILGAMAVLGLIGSYWYLNYFLDEIGIDSEKAIALTRDVGQRGVQAITELPGTPVQSAPAFMGAQAQQAGLVWPQPLFQNPIASPTDPESFPTVVRSILPSVVNVSTQNRSTTLPNTMPMSAPVSSQPNGAQVVQPANVVTPIGPDGLKFASPFSGVAMESIGSGVIVSADGYIVSNFHVVENSQNVFVTVFGPYGMQRYPADVVRLDPTRDLVLLKINVPIPLQPAPLGNSDLLLVGDPVITVGCPFGLDQTVSKGIISGARKAVTIEGTIHKDLIQTDAAINQGNSGGPLVSRYGYVIGINTAIYSPTQAFSGVGFAVPVNSVKEFIAEVISIPEVTPAMTQPGWLGQGRPVAATTRPGPPPIPVNAVAPHGDRGTCENCHVILRSGQPINQIGNTGVPGGANGINISLNPQQPGNPTGSGGVNSIGTAQGLSGMANGADTTNAVAGANGAGSSNAVGAANPSAPAANVQSAILGAEFRPLDDQLVKRFQPPYSTGVFLQSMQPGSLAESGGLQTGDIIFKINGRWVRSTDELQQRLQEIPIGDKVRFSLARKRQRMEVVLIMNPQPVNVVPPLSVLDATRGNPMVPPAQAIEPAKTKTKAKAGQPKPPTEFEWFGMELQPIQKAAAAKNPALKNKQGALVGEVDPGLQADMAGIRANDIVVAINGNPVGSNADLDKAIKASATAKTILLDVERDGKRMFVTMQ